MSCCDKIIEAASQQTPCECIAPGYCERHNCNKTQHHFTLCKNRIDYFNAYERGVGPGQRKLMPVPRQFVVGLGDVAAFLIRLVTFGRLKMCPDCKARKARWNRACPLWPIRWPWGKR